MKSSQSLKWILVFAAASSVIIAQDAAPIRRELKAGSTETYKIENEIKQFVEVPSMGEQDLTINTIATVALKTLAVNAEKGNAEVEALTKVEKLSMDGSIAGMMGDQSGAKLPAPKTEKGTLDSRNRLSIAKDPKAKPSANAMMGMPGLSEIGAQSLLTLIELPEKAWKVGDTAQVGVPGAAGAATMGVKELKMTMTISGEKEVEGQKLWVVTYSGSMKIDFDSSKNPQAGQSAAGNMKMNGTAEVTGEGLVDKATGKTVGNTLKVSNKGTMFIEQAGMEIPVRGTVSMKLTLVK
ncbi:MAG TPA: hypothetical protein VJ835_11595 [Fimbriimonadaceae bacterium]|nr:hypothetical protein [Fimbriimonadaceae bacterium]